MGYGAVARQGGYAGQPAGYHGSWSYALRGCVTPPGET